MTLELTKEQALKEIKLCNQLSVELFEKLNEYSEEVGTIRVMNLVIERLMSVYISNFVSICKSINVSDKQIKKEIDYFIKTLLTLIPKNIKQGKEKASAREQANLTPSYCEWKDRALATLNLMKI